MTTAWLIYDRIGAQKNQTYIDWFITEAGKQQMDLRFIERESLQIGIKNNKLIIYLDNQPISLPKVAIIRTIDPLLSLQFESMGVHVFNNAEIARICNHKGLTHLEMKTLNIPMVDTLFYRREHISITPPLPYPFIVKNVQGKGGTEVFFIKHTDDWRIVQEKLDTEFIVQKTNVQLGKDLRVYILGKEILAAVLRESDTNFKANYTLSGKASLYTLNEMEKQLIHRIVDHFDFDFVGIDFLISPEGNLLFNEVEDIVGSRMLSQLTNINVLEKYVAHILEKIK